MDRWDWTVEGGANVDATAACAEDCNAVTLGAIGLAGLTERTGPALLSDASLAPTKDTQLWRCCELWECGTGSSKPPELG